MNIVHYIIIMLFCFFVGGIARERKLPEPIVDICFIGLICSLVMAIVKGVQFLL